MSRVMSDAEIRRRKKIQGISSRTTGALGLTALGGTLLATKGGSRATKNVFRAVNIERPVGLKPKNLRRKTAPILATSAGIGGATSFNFAAYTSAEAKKRKQVVRKSMTDDLDMAPTYGVEGFAKNWQPVARNYNPESKRQKRGEAYPRIAAAVSGGAGVGAAARGLQALDKITDAKAIRAQNAASGARKMYKPLHAAGMKNLKSAGKLGAVSATAAGGAAVLHHKKKSRSWDTYAKSATSAFGVLHD